ncbi:low specificity L-threonine aldolase [Pseudomonas moorei]|nr:low specificity L-threonine aldolase [Pseudomonas moorei]
MEDYIDLYSDTHTRPSAGMRNAMAKARVGDEQSDEDPTTIELCERVADLLGCEAGVFMPSGTMCNLAAVLTLTRPGDEVICDKDSHLYGTEAAGVAAFAGASILPLESRNGIFTAEQVRNAVRPKARTAPRSSLVSVEQTTNFSGGAIWALQELREVRDVSQELGLNCHIDGARLFNATATTGIPAREYSAGWNSVCVDLSKGLGCPVGGVLCGSKDFIREAWQWKYRLGGAMRQSGILAAAGIYALDYNLPKLGDDNRKANLIWNIISACEHFEFDPAEPESNIIRFTFAHPKMQASVFAKKCYEQGIRVRDIGGNYIRVTTHLDVTVEESRKAANVMADVAYEMFRACQ